MAALAVYEDKDDDLDFLDDLNDLIDNDDDSEDDTALETVKQPSKIPAAKTNSLKRPTALRENVLGQEKSNRVKEQPRKKQRLQNTAEYLERNRGEAVAKKSVARPAKAATATNQRRTDRKDASTQNTHASAEKSKEYFHMPFFESRHKKIDDGRDLRGRVREDFEEFSKLRIKNRTPGCGILDLRRQMKTSNTLT